MVEEFAEKLWLVARQEYAAGEVLKECECGAEKRGREEGNVESRDSKCRKQKVEEPLEEVKTEGACVGPKVSGSSTKMYQYFLKLQSGSQQVGCCDRHNARKSQVYHYEYLVLLDLLKKGHPESTIKIGEGIKAFHPWKFPYFQLPQMLP